MPDRDEPRGQHRHQRGHLRETFKVQPGSRIDLAKLDPAASPGHSKTAAERDLASGLERLTDLQDRLWAEQKHAVLVVLQGIDAAGKDGTIKHVMSAFNPQGCPVTSFKVPTPVEMEHDYLWRAHQRTPAKGEVGIFNRSYYEDVLVVRVHELVPKVVWSRRFDQINAFERMLTEEGTTIVKFFLNISPDEQRDRFQARVDDPTKRWKFRLGDIDERKRWEDYQVAFEDALSRCSTDAAPWYVIPSNRKWFRNVAVAEILADVMEELKPKYPSSPDAVPPGYQVE